MPEVSKFDPCPVAALKPLGKLKYKFPILAVYYSILFYFVRLLFLLFPLTAAVCLCCRG